jgi:DNA-directed RNA polymerase specialized sigma24 family protein
MAIPIIRSELNFPVKGKPPKKDHSSYGQEAKKYKVLLHSIAINLGLNEKESEDLAEHVCLIGGKHFPYQKENFTLRIWLSKILVHDCIFKISSSLFSQNVNAANFFQTNSYLNSPAEFKIPISFRTVYILVNSIGFTEPEVAQMLNITPMQVRERLAKAMAIIKSQRL